MEQDSSTPCDSSLSFAHILHRSLFQGSCLVRMWLERLRPLLRVQRPETEQQIRTHWSHSLHLVLWLQDIKRWTCRESQSKLPLCLAMWSPKKGLKSFCILCCIIDIQFQGLFTSWCLFWSGVFQSLLALRVWGFQVKKKKKKKKKHQETTNRWSRPTGIPFMQEAWAIKMQNRIKPAQPLWKRKKNKPEENSHWILQITSTYFLLNLNFVSKIRVGPCQCFYLLTLLSFQTCMSFFLWRKEVMMIWNDMSACKRWLNFPFQMNCAFETNKEQPEVRGRKRGILGSLKESRGGMDDSDDWSG